MKSSCLALAFAWMLSSFAGVNSASAQSRLQPIKGSSVSVSPSKANVPVRREVKKLVVSIASPNGFEYAGVDENEQSMGDYTFGSTQNTGKYLQWSNEAYDYGRTYYLKHWNVSIKQDYDTSTGIDDLTIAKQPTASAKKGVYSLTGVKLSDGNDLSNLPKGIYVVDGKKVMKR